MRTAERRDGVLCALIERQQAAIAGTTQVANRDLLIIVVIQHDCASPRAHSHGSKLHVDDAVITQIVGLARGARRSTATRIYELLIGRAIAPGKHDITAQGKWLSRGYPDRLCN